MLENNFVLKQTAR